MINPINIISISIYACYMASIVLLIWLIIRKKLSPTLMIIFSTCISLAAADAILVLTDYNPEAIKTRKIHNEATGVINTPNLRMDMTFSAIQNGDLLSIYNLTPSKDTVLPVTEEYTFKYEIDQYGYRFTNPDNWEKPALLTIGDSYTIVSSLPLEKTWPNKLAQLIQSKNWYEAAVNQIGPENYLKILETFAPRMKPQSTVIIGFFESNDLHDLYFSVPQNQKIGLSGLIEFIVNELKEQKKNRISLSIPSFRLANQNWPTLFYKPYILQFSTPLSSTNPNLHKLDQIFASIKSTCTKYQLNCHIVYFPDKFHTYYPQIKDTFSFNSYFQDIDPGKESPSEIDFDQNLNNIENTIQSLVQKNQLSFISLTASLTEASRSQITYWPFDTHLNSYGNEIAARKIAEKITAEQLQK